MDKSKIKKVLFIIFGIAMAIVFCLPYLMFREKIQDLGAVGYIGLIITCAISNVSILLPSSSTLIVLAAASTLNPVLAILCGGIGTCIGEQSSYICGRIGRLSIDHESIKEKKIYDRVKKKSVLTVFIFAFVPLPVFDIVGIAAGILGMNWGKYTLAAALGKILKFAIAVVGVFLLLPAIVNYVPPPFDEIINKTLEGLNAI